jgi:hypothetical protein
LEKNESKNGGETMQVYETVKNNPNKFTQGYIFELDNDEFEILRSKILITNRAKTRILPKAFTEKGLYMLAIVLKSPQATPSTIAIMETFAKIRGLVFRLSHCYSQIQLCL